MAGKKTSSRAEKIVSDTKKKVTSAGGSSSASKKSTSRKSTSSGKKATVTTEYESPIPSSAIVAIFSFLLFILFVVITVNPEGALLAAVKSIVLGLIGQVGFYCSIPALLYLFIIHTFSRKTAVKMRSVYLVCCLLRNDLPPDCDANRRDGFLHGADSCLLLRR